MQSNRLTCYATSQVNDDNPTASCRRRYSHNSDRKRFRLGGAVFLERLRDRRIIPEGKALAGDRGENGNKIHQEYSSDTCP